MICQCSYWMYWMGFDGFIHPMVGRREGATVASMFSIKWGGPVGATNWFPNQVKVDQFLSHTRNQHQPIWLADACHRAECEMYLTMWQDVVFHESDHKSAWLQPWLIHRLSFSSRLENSAPWVDSAVYRSGRSWKWVQQRNSFKTLKEREPLLKQGNNVHIIRWHDHVPSLSGIGGFNDSFGCKWSRCCKLGFGFK